MPIRTAIWKVSAQPEPLLESSLAKEQLLEAMIVADSRVLFDEWMLIGRQVDTGYGGRIDLLAIAPDGSLGTSLNRELVRVGYAWWYRHYSKDATLGQLEAQARDAKLGLWADANPIEPWEFRKGQRGGDVDTALTAPPAAVVPVGVTIIGLLPDPKGKDEGNEQIVIGNGTNQAVSLAGWEAQDAAGHAYSLAGTVPAKGSLTITMTQATMSLNNNGDEVSLIDGKGVVRSRVTYSKAQVRAGQMVRFSR